MHELPTGNRERARAAVGKEAPFLQIKTLLPPFETLRWGDTAAMSPLPNSLPALESPRLMLW